MPAWRIREMIAKREVSAIEVTEHFLNRIEELEPKVHAFRAIDYVGAREAAKAADASQARGEPLGALDPVEAGDEGAQRRRGRGVPDRPQAAVADVPQAGLGDVSQAGAARLVECPAEREGKGGGEPHVGRGAGEVGEGGADHGKGGEYVAGTGAAGALVVVDVSEPRFFRAGV